MACNATLKCFCFDIISAISWRWGKQDRVPGENHRPVASHRQTLSRNHDLHLQFNQCLSPLRLWVRISFIAANINDCDSIFFRMHRIQYGVASPEKCLRPCKNLYKFVIFANDNISYINKEEQTTALKSIIIITKIK
jgi:hypothetical protein